MSLVFLPLYTCTLENRAILFAPHKKCSFKKQWQNLHSCVFWLKCTLLTLRNIWNTSNVLTTSQVAGVFKLSGHANNRSVCASKQGAKSHFLSNYTQASFTQAQSLTGGQGGEWKWIAVILKEIFWFLLDLGSSIKKFWQTIANAEKSHVNLFLCPERSLGD